MDDEQEENEEPKEEVEYIIIYGNGTVTQIPHDEIYIPPFWRTQ